MIIKTKENTAFKDIKLAKCFIWESDYYMKVKLPRGDLAAIKLSSGYIVDLTDSCVVVPVDIEGHVV